MRIGNILSDLLRQRNMSQRELAIRANTTEATISRYISGDRVPRIELVVEIARALNVTTDYLLGVTDSPTVCGDNSSDADELLRCYACCTSDEKRIIWAVLAKYADTIPFAAFGGTDANADNDSQRQSIIKAYEDK